MGAVLAVSVDMKRGKEGRKEGRRQWWWWWRWRWWRRWWWATHVGVSPTPPVHITTTIGQSGAATRSLSGSSAAFFHIHPPSLFLFFFLLLSELCFLFDCLFWHFFECFSLLPFALLVDSSPLRLTGRFCGVCAREWWLSPSPIS